jgi:membrane protease YdiL (CAAX protease family)
VRLSIIGFGCGAAVYLLVFAARWFAVGAQPTTADALRIALILGSALLVAGYQALSEEIVFRGAVFALLPRALSLTAMVAISTALFVAFHLPKWESLISGPYALHLALAGVAFALACVRTGTIWLGFGLHLGWNLGAYLLLEGSPALLTLGDGLPTGWDGWSSWLGVAGNAALLILVLVITRRKRASLPR